MERWIFQTIMDLRNKFLYSSDEQVQEKMKKYNAALRACVKPELYTQYLLWQCDIYVDLQMIEIVVKHIYKDVTTEQVDEWVRLHKEEHHVLV